MSKNISLILVLLSYLGLSCSPSHPSRDPKIEGLRKTEGFNLNVRFNPKVDILLVVDDSGSMMSYQNNLSRNMMAFVNEISRNKLIDYQIGVTTTDWNPRRRRGGFLTGSPSFITKSTPGGLQEISRRVVAGTSGSGDEMFFDNIISTITPPNMGPNGPNGNFIRDDAFLAIIMITDTEDEESQQTTDEFYQALVDIKLGDPLKVLAYGALIPSNISDPTCRRDSEGEPYRLEAFLKKVVQAQGQKEGDNIFNLCDADYGPKLAVIGEDLTNKVGYFIPLGQFPVLNTIVVTYGSQVVPADAEKGWSYDPGRVGIKLSKELELKEEPGAELKVSFLPAEIN